MPEFVLETCSSISHPCDTLCFTSVFEFRLRRFFDEQNRSFEVYDGKATPVVRYERADRHQDFK